MFKYVVYVTLFVAASGQKNCCFPPQWEAPEGILSGSSDDEGHSALTQGQIKTSFDATGQRIYLEENLVVGNVNRQYKILQLYKQNVQYIIENTTCTRTPIGQWAGSCIPDNATMVRKYRLGGEPYVQVMDYRWVQNQLHMTVTVTEDCVPVSETTHGSINGQSVLTLIGYHGLTAGIKDPSVFDIPDICKHARFTNLPPLERRRRSTLW